MLCRTDIFVAPLARARPRQDRVLTDGMCNCVFSDPADAIGALIPHLHRNHLVNQLLVLENWNRFGSMGVSILGRFVCSR
jgi:hypothetical protein